VQKMEQHDNNNEPFDCETPDYFVFHAPYNKLVQKSYARLFLCDARRRYAAEQLAGGCEEKKQENGNGKMNGDSLPALDVEYLTQPMEETYSDRTLEGILKKRSAKSFEQRLADANYASKTVGNTYTASVFLGLASLIDRAHTKLTPGKSIVLFSYGSGALATMYRLQV